MPQTPEGDTQAKGENTPNVYNIYNRKLQVTEKEFINECNQSMDALLVFAGLFSGVVVQLISATTQKLGPQSNGSTTSTPHVGTMTIVFNALFFFSLITSLFASVLAILVKQWARRSTSGFGNISSARRRARARYEKNEGREIWHLEDVVSFVPMMIHFAFLLFFVGLILWIKTLNLVLFYVVTVTIVLLGATHLTASALPLKWSDAPYEWQLTTLLRWVGDTFFDLINLLGTPFRLCRPSRENKTPLLGEHDSGFLMQARDPSWRPFVTTPESQSVTLQFDASETALDEIDVELMMETLHRADTDQEVQIALSQLCTSFRRVDIPSRTFNRGHMELALTRLRELSAQCWHSIDEEQTKFILRKGHLSRAKDAARFLEWLLQLDTRYLSLVLDSDIIVGVASWKLGLASLDLESVVLGASVTYRGEHLIGARGPSYSCTHPRSGREVLDKLYKWGPFAADAEAANSDTKVPDVEWNEENRNHHRNMVEDTLSSLTDCLASHYHPEDGANDIVFQELVGLADNLIKGTKELGIYRLRHYVRLKKRELPGNHWAEGWFNLFDA